MSLSHAPVAVARHVQLLVFSLKSLWSIPALKYGFATSFDHIFYKIVLMSPKYLHLPFITAIMK